MPIGSETTGVPVLQHWTLEVLGHFRLTDAAGGEIALPGRIDPALLTYLALNQGRRHIRAKLATLLWATRADAAHSLSVSLNKLRNALGDTEGRLITPKSDPVATDFRAIAVDALTFEQLAAQDTRDALERAEALFTGELLDGFDLRSEDFEQWLTAERRRLRDILADVLRRLLHLRAQAGETDQAIATAQRLLELDNFNEEGYRVLIQLYLRAGRRSAALRAAENCEKILQREGFQLEAETKRLIADLRQSMVPEAGQIPEQKGNGTPPSIPVTPEPPAPPAPPHPQQRSWGRLRRWALIAALLLLVAAAAVLGRFMWRYWNVPWLAPNPVDNAIVWVRALLPGEAPLRIAVLRFGSPSSDPEADTLAQGLSEDITTALGKVSEMFVINAASVLPYGPNPTDLRQVAQDLDVRYLLLGSVQQSSEQLRVQVRLVDSDEGRQVWGNSYPGLTGDVFDLRDRITFDVITEVQVRLTDGDMERITAIHGTRNLAAWLASGEGLKLLRHLIPEDNARARMLYNKAITLDPNYAGAYEGLAWTYLLEAEFGWSRSAAQSLGEAQRLTQRALELDPKKNRLYSLRGHLSLLLRNFDPAVADGESVVEKEPNDADAAALLAFTLTYTGEPKRAIALINRAIELSPRYPAWYGWALGRAYRLAGDPDQAIQTLEANMPQRPASIIPLVEIVIAYREAGDSAMAQAMAATIREKVPNFSVRAWAAAQPYEELAMIEQDAAALLAAGLPE
jgi:TolB-like protein/DNA-binding SARP family transcriptional activator/Tfp pilus assembly protein PilF